MSILTRVAPPPLGQIGPKPAPAQDIAGGIARGLLLDRIRTPVLASGTVLVPVGEARSVCTWQAAEPRHVVVQVVTHRSLASSRRPRFHIGWGAGQGAFQPPPIELTLGGPLVLFAAQVSIMAIGGAADFTVSALVAAVDDAAAGPSRPLLVWDGDSDVASNIGRSIAAAGNETFFLSAYTRRIRVGRTDLAQSFTVTMPGGIGASLQVAANADMPWMEWPVPLVGVTNTGALATTFTVLEELGL